MGTYTTNLKLYKPAPTEFVDPEVQLNNNWNILDTALKRLLEYEYTTATVPDVKNAISRSRFYKAYSNSFMTYFKNPNFFYQDPSAFVSSWTNANNLLVDGWMEHDDMPLFYRTIERSGSSIVEVEWVGAIWTGNSIIDANTNTIFMAAGSMPEKLRPQTSKYWTTYAGNTASNYSIARIFISPTGQMDFKRYGVNPAPDSVENRIELTGIKYSVEVTG